MIVATLCVAARGAMVTPSPALRARLERAKLATGWQRRLDRAFLDVDATLSERLNLLRGVVQDGEDVSSDLRTALHELRGDTPLLLLDLLLPVGTTARADLEGLAALRKQVPELNFKAPTPAELHDQLQGRVVPTAQDLQQLTDARRRDALLEEAKNALRSTPVGLETPGYTVVRSWPVGGALDGVCELRRYENLTVSEAMGGDDSVSYTHLTLPTILLV